MGRIAALCWYLESPISNAGWSGQVITAPTIDQRTSQITYNNNNAYIKWGNGQIYIENRVNIIFAPCLAYTKPYIGCTRTSHQGLFNGVLLMRANCYLETAICKYQSMIIAEPKRDLCHFRSWHSYCSFLCFLPWLVSRSTIFAFLGEIFKATFSSFVVLHFIFIFSRNDKALSCWVVFVAKHRCLYLWAIRWRTVLFMVKLLSCWYLLLSIIRVHHFLFNYNAEYVYVYDMIKELMCYLRTFKQHTGFGRRCDVAVAFFGPTQEYSFDNIY